ncbi:pentapeptide repeat-containing protein [Amycolatopsis sp. NPDC101161]|uniref:pentapeptide repeat-containing protein n=1 Tax=Amycolatopsis sp. NPDC101161 TaxID=3363940 RepID=UPI0037FB4B78
MRQRTYRGEGFILLLVGVILFCGAWYTLNVSSDWFPSGDWFRHWILYISVIIVATLSCISGARRVFSPSASIDKRNAVRPIRWWVIAACVVVVAGVTWIAINWLLANVSTPAGGAGNPTLKLESIKTGLTVGAGAGAVIALGLNARRQWLTERTQEHTEQDATERRVTELYTKAAEQLGADKDPVVRMASLHSLERLAQDNPEHRQTIVKIICAYLRMPFTCPPNLTSVPNRLPREIVNRRRRIFPSRDRHPSSLKVKRQELQVRLTAQAILSDHLYADKNRFGRARNIRFWDGMELDLTEATLVDFDLSSCHVSKATFTRSQFVGLADFSGTVFEEDVWLDDAHIQGLADFSEAVFKSSAHFWASRFDDGVNFSECHFIDEVKFGDATFRDACTFDNAIFEGNASFEKSRFIAPTAFESVKFKGETTFNACAFESECDFTSAAFDAASKFEGVHFGNFCKFWDTTFWSSITFEGTLFSNLTSFMGATFHESIRFDGVVFLKEVHFTGVTFRQVCWFRFVEFGDHECRFERATFRADARFDDAFFHGLANFQGGRFMSSLRFNGASFASRISFAEAKFETGPRFDGAIARLPRTDISEMWPARWRVDDALLAETRHSGSWARLVR